MKGEGRKRKEREETGPVLALSLFENLTKNRSYVFGLTQTHLLHQGQSGALHLNPAGAPPRDHY